MSSVTRFLRQIPVSTTFYTLTATQQNLASTFYAMTPEIAGGNYPGSVAAIDAGTAAQVVTMTLGSDVYLLRDMGKTIKATVTGQTVPTFFREVQVLNPVTAPWNATGGVGGNNYTNLSAYFTFYVPVAMPGFSSGLAPVAMTPVAGGQL